VEGMDGRSFRGWIWAALCLQLVGYVVDAVWHGLLSPGVEPQNVGEMIRHLGTVHLPLYVGAASVLVATSTALARGGGRSIGVAVAAAGGWLSAGAEAWHAYAHLRLDTHTAPIAGGLSLLGFLVATLAMATSGWARRRRAARPSVGRRAA